MVSRCFSIFSTRPSGRPRFLVPRAPNQQFQQYWRQIDPFLRQAVVYPSSVRLVHLRADDPRGFELPQPVRQDVGGDPFGRPWKSLNVRKPRTIRSRMISSDQRSPNISREMLTGHSDRCFSFFPATLVVVTISLAECK